MGAATPAARPGPSNFQDVPNVTINGQRTNQRIAISTLPGTKVPSQSTSGFGFFIPIDRSRRALQASDVSYSNFGTLRKLLAF